MTRVWIFFIALIVTTSCDAPQENKTAFEDPPVWAREAIWYQIFPERFANGDPTNDPQPEDMLMAWPGAAPEGWKISNWTKDWYATDEWESAYTDDFYRSVQLRRYGGDIQGIIDKLDYLEDLGITALYINPMNDAPSLHKYDARSYRHIDRNFGPNPTKDKAIAESEDPTDPDTWQFTSADQLFLNLIDKAHKKGMKVVLDYSWNHTGVSFWAWQDVLKKQKASKYASWYEIESFDNPETEENEFAYTGWAGVETLPELKKVDVVNRKHGHPYEGYIYDPVKEHIFNVSKRWMDPNGDGDTSDGVDGYRLDVADQIPMGFWRDYRKFVRSVNPDFYLIGEIWWEEWPDHLMDPRPYMQGDIFDAVMHYQWYKPARKFFAQTAEGMTASEFVQELKMTQKGIAPAMSQAMMNLTASHDSPRFSSSLYNADRPYKNGVNPRDNKGYKLEKPDARTKHLQKMLLMQQFTFIGSPQIWNGDELGMWGADDPDNRKPIIWPEMEFETEKEAPFGINKPANEVRADLELLDYYKRLIKIRKENKALSYGELNFLKTDNKNLFLGYRRTLDKEEVLVLFNRSETERSLSFPKIKGVYKDAFTGEQVTPSKTVNIARLAGRILIK
ncbi:alpha-amylase (plasmid) [Fulvitalea axinellae]|uniref:Alpha-amylase n=1 Tax=Fulvitalea axinellae TaxID=1182444 RepID=A0AAU9CTH2_9BACT|nr:alpha-amylase [Fulvitalea axinellae]